MSTQYNTHFCIVSHRFIIWKSNYIKNILLFIINNFFFLSRCTQRPTSILTGIAELTDSLYLCSAVAIKPALLQALGITCVINAAAELPDTPLPNNDTQYYKVPVQDRINCDLLQHFDTVSDLIEDVSINNIFWNIFWKIALHKIFLLF